MMYKNFSCILILALFFASPASGDKGMQAEPSHGETVSQVSSELQKTEGRLRAVEKKTIELEAVLKERKTFSDQRINNFEKVKIDIAKLEAGFEYTNNRIKDSQWFSGIVLTLFGIFVGILLAISRWYYRKQKKEIIRLQDDSSRLQAESREILNEMEERLASMKGHEEKAVVIVGRMEEYEETVNSIPTLISQQSDEAVSKEKKSVIFNRFMGKYKPLSEEIAEEKGRGSGEGEKEIEKEIISQLAERIKKLQSLSKMTENLDVPLPASHFFNLAYDLAESGEFEKAIDNYTKAIELKKDYAEAYNNRGVLFDKRNEDEKALADFDKAIELKKDFAGAYNNRGNLFAKRNEDEKALADYNKAIELEKDFAMAYNNRAELLITIYSFGEAVEGLLPNFLRFKSVSDKITSLYLLKVANAGMGKVDAEIDEQYEKLLKNNPTVVLEDWDFNVIDRFIEDAGKSGKVQREQFAQIKKIHADFKKLGKD